MCCDMYFRKTLKGDREEEEALRQKADKANRKRQVMVDTLNPSLSYIPKPFPHS